MLLGALGHTRLSIVDVATSHQPMTDGQHWIVFNGEIYNFQSLLELQLSGPWLTQGDTEVVMRLIMKTARKPLTRSMHVRFRTFW